MPRDLSADLDLVAGNPTAAAESARLAMDAAGIPPGAPGVQGLQVAPRRRRARLDLSGVDVVGGHPATGCPP